MSEENTKQTPGPFDGFESAKPNEPIFTLQGGDPLGAPLVQLWADLARVRAGSSALSGDAIMARLQRAVAVALGDKVLDPKKADALLLRASEAEKVVWSMDDYRTGREELPDERASYNDAAPDEAAKAAKSEHSLRLHHESRLQNAIGEMANASEFGASIGLDVAGYLESAIVNARAASDEMKPSR